jgi:DNA-binding MarR family transcriptional regulator
MRSTSKIEKAEDLVSSTNLVPLVRLVLEIFRINGRLLVAGDRLTEALGLTSARWQVLGAVRYEALTVAQIGRNMGLQRQSVQRIVDVLVGEGLLELKINPNHKRAKLVCVCPSGQRKLARLRDLQVVWADRIGEGIAAIKILRALELLQHLRRRLESDERH